MTNTISINDRLGPGGLENVGILSTDVNGNTVLVGADGVGIHIGARLVHSNTAPDTMLDVRAELNQQLAALQPGELLYLRAGEYIVSKELSDNWCLLLQENYTGIVGDGMGKTIIKVSDGSGASPAVLRGDSLTGVYLADFTVDGNNARAGASASAEGEGINLKLSVNARLINVEARNTDQDGFDLDDATEAVLIGCRAKDCWGNGYHLAGASTYAIRCQIIGCSSEGCGQERALLDAFGEGISVSGVGSVISGYTSVNDSRGISIDGTGVTVSNAFVLDAGDGTTAGVGIRLLSNSTGSTINGCTVSRTVNHATVAGITLTAGGSTVASNCTVRGCGGGIHLSGGNAVVGCRVVSPAAQGILSTGSAGRHYIKNNVITSPGHGIRCDIADAEIEGNTIISPTLQGIDLRADGATVMNNRVVGGAAYGVRMFDATVDNAKVCFNVLNATSGGVSLAGTGHVVASNMINDTFTA